MPPFGTATTPSERQQGAPTPFWSKQGHRRPGHAEERPKTRSMRVNASWDRIQAATANPVQTVRVVSHGESPNMARTTETSRHPTATAVMVREVRLTSSRIASTCESGPPCPVILGPFIVGRHGHGPESPDREASSRHCDLSVEPAGAGAASCTSSIKVASADANLPLRLPTRGWLTSGPRSITSRRTGGCRTWGPAWIAGDAARAPTRSSLRRTPGPAVQAEQI